VKIIFLCSKAITFNTFLRSQANYLKKKKFNVIVACSESSKLNFCKDLIYEISFPNKKIEFFDLFNYFKIFRQISILVDKNPSGIFYLHTPLASHLFRFFTFFKNIKIIYFIHGFRFVSRFNSLKDFLFKIIEKILAFKTKIFITINNYDFHYVKFILAKKKPYYKINGVGLNLQKNHFKKKLIKKGNIKKILVIAAYKKQKGYFEILKIAEMLKKNKIKIYCYGYGSYKKFKAIKIKNKVHNIKFNNFDINLKNKIKKFDLLLHLSEREGLPVAVMQSLSEGLPVICYNIRGNNDLIINDYNGYFVDSFKEVPKKISYLNLKNDVYNKMRLNAFKSINKDFVNKKINLTIYKIIKKHFN